MCGVTVISVPALDVVAEAGGRDGVGGVHARVGELGDARQRADVVVVHQDARGGADLAFVLLSSARTTTSAMSVLTSAPLKPSPGMSVSRPVCGSGVLRPNWLNVMTWLSSVPPWRPISTPREKLPLVSSVTIGAFDQHLRAALVELADELLVQPLHVRRGDDDDAVGVRIGGDAGLLRADRRTQTGIHAAALLFTIRT